MAPVTLRSLGFSACEHPLRWGPTLREREKECAFCGAVRDEEDGHFIGGSIDHPMKPHFVAHLRKKMAEAGEL